MTERRKSIRHRTLLDGRIRVEKLHGFAVDCSVRNVGAGGARLAIPGHVLVPQTFQLSISDGAPKAARLVWYKDGQAGLAFHHPQIGPVQPRDGTCRRNPRQVRTGAPAETNTLQTRITAIAARSGLHDRRATP